MKKQFLAIAILALSLSNSAYAMMGNDTMSAFARCESQDLGNDQLSYSIVLSSGGFAFHYSAELIQKASRGVKEKSKNYFLKAVTPLNYVDALTDGQEFSLKLQNEPLVGRSSKANLKVQTSSGVFTKEFTCNRLLRNY